MKRISLLKAALIANIGLAVFLFAGIFVPVDYDDTYRVDGVDVTFMHPENFDCGDESSVVGCATIDGSEMQLSRSLGFIEVYVMCNHEMRHVKGFVHEEMSDAETSGLRPSPVCGELVFGKVI